MVPAFTCSLEPRTSLTYGKAPALAIHAVERSNRVSSHLLGHLCEAKTFLGNYPDVRSKRAPPIDGRPRNLPPQSHHKLDLEPHTAK